MKYVLGICMISEMLKQYSYDLIVAIGKQKRMNRFEIKKMVNEFWKVQYYTPDVVGSKLKEDVQKYIS